MKISCIAILAAVLCVLLKQSEKATALGFSVLACTVILLLGFLFFQPVWDMIRKLEKLSGLGSDTVKPLFKVVAVGLLTQLAGSICNEAGESALAKTVEISGSFLAIYVSLPLLSAVLSLVEKLIGGAF